ncbi:MAG: transcriptional regulator [Subtercola sp.]|nr:transcriptional regulator [Subtercola sp.]
MNEPQNAKPTGTQHELRVTSSLELVRWIGWAQRKVGEDWIKARELSHEQAFALGFLAQNPGSIQRDIAQMTRTSAASVSSLLQGLERRGLVERRTEGGNERSKRVYATPTGVDLIAGFETAMTAADDTILAPLNQAERETLHALLTKVTSVLPQPTRG